MADDQNAAARAEAAAAVRAAAAAIRAGNATAVEAAAEVVLREYRLELSIPVILSKVEDLSELHLHICDDILRLLATRNGIQITETLEELKEPR